MNLVEQFQSYIKTEGLFDSGNKLLIAVSGGLDSIVLCELCVQCGYHFTIAHCNFGLRGEESERDEAFVTSLAAKYHVPLIVRKFNTTGYAASNKVSIQVAARELRYTWFFSLVNDASQGSSFVLTAHHLDDNIETMLMHFFRGTGISGLRGILPKQEKLRRPLLFARKEALEEFAVAHQLKWVEDSSNNSTKYTRNSLRLTLKPVLETLYPEAWSNLGDNLSRYKDVEILYNEALDASKKKLLEHRGDEVHIPVLKLKKSSAMKTLLYEAIRHYGFSSAQLKDAVQLLDAQTGKYIQSSSHRLLRNRNLLILSPLNTTESNIIVINEATQTVEFGQGQLSFDLLSSPDVISTDRLHANLDASQIKFPLLLRKWKQGDYFYPLGMNKKKKVARFLIDNKLSQAEKENTWVLEMERKIIWIVGHRIDDRFKSIPTTQNILQIKMRVS